MKRIISAVLATVLATLLAIPATAEEKCLKWTHPGRDANERTLEQTVADMGLPTKEDEAKVVATMDRAVVRVSAVIAEIDKLGDKKERDRLTKLVRATKNQFFAKEAVENLGLPSEVTQTILVSANLETNLYESEIVSAGYRTGSMVFGKNKMADCVVLQPAKGQPQTIVIHHFPIVLSDGNEWIFDHSTICSNVGKKKGKRVEQKPPPELPKPTVLAKVPNQRVYTLRINYVADRPDSYWEKKYEDEQVRRAKALKEQGKVDPQTPYRDVFVRNHVELLGELRARPLGERKFLVQLLDKMPSELAFASLRNPKKDPEARAEYQRQLAEIQRIPDANVITSLTATTNDRGYAIISLPIPPEQFKMILIQPAGDTVVTPWIWVDPSEFNQPNPIHVWEVKTK